LFDGLAVAVDHGRLPVVALVAVAVSDPADEDDGVVGVEHAAAVGAVVRAGGGRLR
jgi:hypothetical protein